MGTEVTESLDGVMVSTQARNSIDVGSIPALGVLFPLFNTPVTLVPLPRSCKRYALCGC